MSSMQQASKRYHLVRTGRRRWEFRRRENPMWILLLGVGVVPFIVFLLANDAFLGLVVSTIPLLIALLLGLAYVQGSVQAVVDTKRRSVWRPRIEDGEPWSYVFNDIHAFQVLRRDDGTDVAELNLVLTTGRRVHVIQHGGGRQVAFDTRRIASRVGVPVWDETVPPSVGKPTAHHDSIAQGDTVPDQKAERRDAMAYLLSPSAVALVLANLGPLASVLFGDWTVLTVFTIYWWETVIVGVIGILRLGFAIPLSSAWWRIKAPVIPFFIIHYGFFVSMHGLVIARLFGRATFAQNSIWDITPLLSTLKEQAIWFFVSLFAVSHGISFVSNYLKGQEYARADLAKLMTAPYARVGVLHIALILSIIAFQPLTPLGIGLAILVIVKSCADLLAHVVEHSKILATASGSAEGAVATPEPQV
jgi:hypothetical protein